MINIPIPRFAISHHRDTTAPAVRNDQFQLKDPDIHFL